MPEMKESFLLSYIHLTEYIYIIYNYQLYEDKLFIYIVNRINATQQLFGKTGYDLYHKRYDSGQFAGW